MTGRDARKHDDGRDDPENPIVPFRMSDRIEMVRLRWLLYAIFFLTVTSPWAGALIGHVMAHPP